MPVAMGLVGAGPWATRFHAPLLAAGPETRLAAVWARRPDAAAALAAAHGAVAADSFDELLDSCDAVAFAVPPDIQAGYAVRAAAAGKALLLEKPLGLTLDQAQQVVDAVGASGVVSMLMLTNRYTPRVRAFLAAVAGLAPIGTIARSVSGAVLPGEYFATPWRIEYGALLDVGPHILDLLDAAAGPIVDVQATGDPRRWVVLVVRHENGSLSQAAMSLAVPGVAGSLDVALYSDRGEVVLGDAEPGDDERTAATIRAEFGSAVASGRPPELAVQRGLYLQRLIDAATRSL